MYLYLMIKNKKKYYLFDLKIINFNLELKKCHDQS